MRSRLVVGGGSVAGRVLEATADHGRTRVLVDPDATVEVDVDVDVDVETDELAVERGDPTDPAAYPEVDAVFVADQPVGRARAVAEAARTALPDAVVVAALDTEASDDDRGRDRDAVVEVADRVVACERVAAESVLDAVVGTDGTRARRLRRTLRAVAGRGAGRLAVVAHDNPDPDAIASAVALARIAETVGVEAVPCYYGEVSHQENRALVNLLDLDLRRLDPGADLEAFDGVALVDHSRPGVNDQLPPDLAVDVVVDHHPPREPVEADFVDLRSEVGATSTLLTGYLDRFGVDAYGGGRLASALLYGIRVDTAEFTREATAADFEAAAALSPHVDTDALERVESPSLTGETLDVIGDAVRSREIRGEALASCVGAVGDRDALAQAADRLLELEDVTTTLVFGYTETDDADVEPTVYASARARGTRVDLGETLRLAFDRLGSAGGHADMAGAQIPLSALGPDVLDADGERRERIVREVLGEIFFDAVADRPLELPRVSADAYDTDDDGDGDDGDRPSGRRSRA
jgi:nanoRNase/pAp phosphatase (c-di-AMP/oligoRNAs hydrolase)